MDVAAFEFYGEDKKYDLLIKKKKKRYDLNFMEEVSLCLSLLIKLYSESSTSFNSAKTGTMME